MSNEAKLCPLKAGVITYTASPAVMTDSEAAAKWRDEHECDGEQCQWWIGDSGTCAVTTLGFAAYLSEVRNA